FNVPRPSEVKLHIFNLNGQLVRTLVSDDLPQGVHQRRWNGRNNAGYPIASGVYLYRLQVGEKVYNGRVQMIK
ncbi:MAG: FlgD immunoglobulin-like domain containing protein, partial [bacterium]